MRGNPPEIWVLVENIQNRATLPRQTPCDTESYRGDHKRAQQRCLERGIGRIRLHIFCPFAPAELCARIPSLSVRGKARHIRSTWNTWTTSEGKMRAAIRPAFSAPSCSCETVASCSMRAGGSMTNAGEARCRPVPPTANLRAGTLPTEPFLTQHWQQFFFCFLLPPFLELQAAWLEMTVALPSSPEGTAV